MVVQTLLWITHSYTTLLTLASLFTTLYNRKSKGLFIWARLPRHLTYLWSRLVVILLSKSRSRSYEEASWPAYRDLGSYCRDLGRRDGNFPIWTHHLACRAKIFFRAHALCPYLERLQHVWRQGLTKRDEIFPYERDVNFASSSEISRLLGSYEQPLKYMPIYAIQYLRHKQCKNGKHLIRIWRVKYFQEPVENLKCIRILQCRCPTASNSPSTGRNNHIIAIISLSLQPHNL